MNDRPRCLGLTDIMYGEALDLRDEIGKEEREEIAKDVCSECTLQLACIEKALLNNEELGVWGGFTPGERREFRRWLNRSGYRGVVPMGRELQTLIDFYRGEHMEVKQGTTRRKPA